MKSSIGKITWGFIWRLFLWSFAISLVLLVILRIVAGSGISNITFDVDSLIDTMSSLKIYVIGYVVINIITIILSCRFSTSGITGKFSIDETNLNAVIRNVIIVLVVCAVLMLIYNMSQMSEISESFDNMNESVPDLKSLSFSDETDELVEEIESYISLVKFAEVAIIVSNVVVVIGMVPFVRKWINNAATTA